MHLSSGLVALCAPRQPHPPPGTLSVLHQGSGEFVKGTCLVAPRGQEESICPQSPRDTTVTGALTTEQDARSLRRSAGLAAQSVRGVPLSPSLAYKSLPENQRVGTGADA